MQKSLKYNKALHGVLPESILLESEDDYYVLVLDEENNDTDYFFKKIKINSGNICEWLYRNEKLSRI